MIMEQKWNGVQQGRTKETRIKGCYSAWGSACYLLHDDFLLGLFFHPEDGGDMFL
jgi:hypothetical protein